MTPILEEKVRGIIREHYDPESVESLLPDTDLRECGVNSLDFVKMIVRLELEFGIEFGEEEFTLENLRTPRQIVTYLDSKLQGLFFSDKRKIRHLEPGLQYKPSEIHEHETPKQNVAPSFDEFIAG